MRGSPALWMALVVALAACGRSAPERQAPGSGVEPPARVETPVADAWTVGPTGLGPLHVGMTVAEAERVLGAPLTLNPEEAPCTYALDKTRPAVAFMVIEGRIARVDVRDSTVATAEGARIGDAEERIHSLYRGRVEVQPHKYVDGHYLIVRPDSPADSTHRLIFETDGRRVTTYRGGRMPEVAWIEGCS